MGEDVRVTCPPVVDGARTCPASRSPRAVRVHNAARDSVPEAAPTAGAIERPARG